MILSYEHMRCINYQQIFRTNIKTQIHKDDFIFKIYFHFFIYFYHVVIEPHKPILLHNCQDYNTIIFQNKDFTDFHFSNKKSIFSIEFYPIITKQESFFIYNIDLLLTCIVAAKIFITYE